MEARVHAARLAWYDAAARLVAGQPVKKEAAIAKLIASNAAMDNARAATQVFGGYGFMNEFPVARFYRDPRSWRLAREPRRCSGCTSPGNWDWGKYSKVV
jgi:short/branched chain acyl-CoA dehydrogenase